MKPDKFKYGSYLDKLFPNTNFNRLLFKKGECYLSEVIGKPLKVTSVGPKNIKFEVPLDNSLVVWTYEMNDFINNFKPKRITEDEYNVYLTVALLK
jgi:hypothetical protein